MNIFNGKSILVTGGNGSFVKELVKTILKHAKPKKLVIFSRDELKQYSMAQKFSPDKFNFLRYFIGDVRDIKLYRAFSNIDIVVHAAAMKHVTASEYNPTECIATNIIGAQNIIDAAIFNQVSKVIFPSPDKANPLIYMGLRALC